jgi:hypothetical protein
MGVETTPEISSQTIVARQAVTPDQAQQIEPQSAMQETFHRDCRRKTLHCVQSQQHDRALNADPAGEPM